MRRCRVRFSSISIVSIMVLLSVLACASSSPPTKRILIRVEVQPPGASLIKSLVEDGDFLRIEDHNRTLAFKPDVQSRPAKIRVFEIQTDSAGKETQHLLEEPSVEVGPNTSPVKVLQNYSVRILEVITPKT